MKYIGITGQQSVYRKVVAWLMGGILDEFERHPGEDCRPNFDKQIEQLKTEGLSCLGSSNLVVLESFGAYILDQMKLFVGSAYNLDIQHYSDLSNYIIDLDTFEVHAKKMDEYVYESSNIIQQDFSKNCEVSDIIQQDFSKDCEVSDINQKDLQKFQKNLLKKPNKITLKDFIIRFGECLKKEFGEDIWVKSVDSWVSIRDDEAKYVIYTDVKTNEELNHILKNDGIIINVMGPEEKKVKCYNKITEKYKAYDIKVPFDIKDIKNIDKFYYNLLQACAAVNNSFKNF